MLQHVHLKTTVHLQTTMIQQDNVVLNVWYACQKKSENSSKRFMNNASLISYQGNAGEYSDMFRSVLSAVKLC